MVKIPTRQVHRVFVLLQGNEGNTASQKRVVDDYLLESNSNEKGSTKSVIVLLKKKED
jgi:hypothetical protein